VIVRRVAPSPPPAVPWVVFFAVAVAGANAQHRFLARNDDDPDLGLDRIGEALDQDDDQAGPPG
jgi:hypothetical protein